MDAGRFKPRGRGYLRLYDADGSLVEERAEDNLITLVGEAHFADRMTKTPGESVMSHMAIGSGTSQTAASTILETELGRVALTGSSPTQGAGGDDNDILYDATFAAGTGTGTIAEVAVFNDPSTDTGVMLNYLTGFAPIAKSASQSLVVTVTVTVGSS